MSVRRAMSLVHALSALGSIVAFLGCEQADPTRSADSATMTAANESTSSDVTLTVANGETFRELVEQRQGDVVLVDFWATWCGPCQEQFPHTVAKSVEHADQGLSVISVSCDDPDDQEPVLEFLRERRASTVTNLISEHGMKPATNEEFEILGGLPWYIVYDRAGERHIFCDAAEPGVDALPVDQLDAKLEEFLAESRP